MTTSRIRVTSEIGRLRKVIVHAPGAELLAVTPSNREEYLYDDILDLERAHHEHQQFTAVLKHFATVFEVRDLLNEALTIPEAKQFLLKRSEEVTGDKTLLKKCSALPNATLVQYFLEGLKMPSGAFSTKLAKHSFILPPLPNMFFTRDAAIVIGEGSVISTMRFVSRWPEEAIMRTLFSFHPELCGQPIYYDGSSERHRDFNLEGGDIHPLTPELVLLGISERTSPAAVDVLCERLFLQSEVKEVIAVVLPEHSTAIHLDMVFTQVDCNLCLLFQPMFYGPQRAPVLHYRKNHQHISEAPSLFAALESCGLKLEPIFCGGQTVQHQEREQWASGCNTFAVSEGVVLAYARNDETLSAMQQAGFRLIDGEALLLGNEVLGANEKAVILVPGDELVRGGGGPRCMTCPIFREDVNFF